MLKSKKRNPVLYPILKMLHYVKKYKKVHLFGIVATVMTHTIKLMSYLFCVVNAIKKKKQCQNYWLLFILAPKNAIKGDKKM